MTQNIKISLSKSEVSVNVGASLDLSNYLSSATDNKDGDVTEKVTVNKVEKDSNNFEEHYTVTDSSGNKAETVRYVKIIDTTAPVIKLKGASVVSIITGNKYTEQGATATDNKDGDVSKDIKISGDVDTSKDGTYIEK